MASVATALTALTFTGERFTPEVRGPIWYEHWHRYAAVASLAAGKRVLDAACGEGYGSYLLAQSARQVTGVDLAPDAIAHARARYPRDNLAFVAGSVTALPLATASVDLVVSFETIEHLTAQREMLAEFRRVMTPAGVLVISSPNRPVYNEGGGVENHYHVRELDRAELQALVDPLFPRQAWHAQRILAQSALWAEEAGAADASYLMLTGDLTAVAAAPAAPMYFVVICGGEGAQLPALPALSLFDDGTLALWRDYARALAREKELAWDELDSRKIAHDRLAELVAAVNELASVREVCAAQTARIAALEDSLRREAQAHAGTSESLAREREAHADTRSRLVYRESAKGWMRYPFAVARRRLASR